MGRFKLIGLLLIAGSAVASEAVIATQSQSDTLTRFTFTEYHMGVDARLVVYSKDKKTAEDACAAAFERIAALDTIMSDYRPNSELMRLCDKAGGAPVHVSPDLFKVLAISEGVSRNSNGYFDITVGPVVKLWRAARKTGVLPARTEIEKARKLLGWKLVKLDRKAQTVRLPLPGMRLDLGAIGKGYAADEAQKVLQKFGISSALVEMGGDIVVSQAPPGTPGWTVTIPKASTGIKDIDLKFVNCAISTSGDAEQFVVIGGVRYSHVVDPHTGYALTKGVQATVFTSTGLIADPVSTAMTMLDRAGREKLQAAYPNTGVFVPAFSLLNRSKNAFDKNRKI